MKNKFGLLFLVLPSMADIAEYYTKVTRFCDSLCASYKIISVTPTGWLKTQIFEKGYFLHRENRTGRFFSRFIEYEKTQGTNYSSPKGFVTVIVQVMRSFLEPTRSMEAISQKKAILPMKHNFGHFCHTLTSMADLR